MSRGGTQVAQVIAELGGFRGRGGLAGIVRPFETMMQDHFALLDYGIAVGARQQREQHDVMAKLLAQALEIRRKGGLGRCRVEECRRLFIQEGGEAADKKTETHGWRSC